MLRAEVHTCHQHGVQYGVHVGMSQATALQDCLARSRAVRQDLLEVRAAAGYLGLARATLAECHKRGVEVHVAPEAFGLYQLLVARAERASKPLLQAIGQQRAAIVMLLMQREQPAPTVQGRLFG